jgi:hypothetical protein
MGQGTLTDGLFSEMGEEVIGVVVLGRWADMTPSALVGSTKQVVMGGRI